MSDTENKDTPVQETNESTEVEVRARSMGWVPKDEWNGEGKWRDADEFVDRGELFEKINSQRKALKNLEENQRAFTQHLDTVRKAEYKRALDEIRKEKKVALAEGDADALIEADEKLIALQRQANVPAPQPQVEAGPHPEFVAWQARNPWYTDTNRAMKAFADAEGVRLGSLVQSGQMTPAEVLREIETQVRREFPEKFTNPNRSKPGAVEGSRGSGNTAKADSYQLTEDEHRVMTRLVKSGIMTKEKYIADVKAAKGEK